MGKIIKKYSGKVTEFYFSVPRFTIDDFVDCGIEDEKLEYFWDNFTKGDGDYIEVYMPDHIDYEIETQYLNLITFWIEQEWEDRKEKSDEK